MTNEEKRKYHKEWYQRHKAEICQELKEKYHSDAEYRQKKKDENETYRNANKNKIAEYKKEYSQKNKEKVQNDFAKYYKENKEEISKKRKIKRNEVKIIVQKTS